MGEIPQRSMGCSCEGLISPKSSNPIIVHGGAPYFHWWEMFETTYVPAHAFIDQATTYIIPQN